MRGWGLAKIMEIGSGIYIFNIDNCICQMPVSELHRLSHCNTVLNAVLEHYDAQVEHDSRYIYGGCLYKPCLLLLLHASAVIRPCSSKRAWLARDCRWAGIAWTPAAIENTNKGGEEWGGGGVGGGDALLFCEGPLTTYVLAAMDACTAGGKPWSG